MKTTMSYFRADELRKMIGSAPSAIINVSGEEKAEMATTWAKTSGSTYREAISTIAVKGGSALSSARIAELAKLNGTKGLLPTTFIAPATTEENIEIMSFWAKASSPICYFNAICNIFLNAKEEEVNA